MKRSFIFVSILVMAALVLSTVQVTAAPLSVKPTPKAESSHKPDTGKPDGVPPGNGNGRQTDGAPGKSGEQHPGKPQDDQTGNTEDKASPQNIKGAVSAVDAASLTLTLADGTTQVFVVSDKTQVKIPTVKNAAITDVAVGAQVMVQARADKDGALVALKIQVIPGKPTKIHRVGVVTEYTAGVSITIEAKDGTTTTFKLTETTKILPAHRADKLVVGAQVTIISRRSPAGGELTAQGIVIHGPEESGTDGTGTDGTGTDGTGTDGTGTGTGTGTGS